MSTEYDLDGKAGNETVTIDVNPRVYDFKSVGDLSTDRKFQRKVNEIPIGIKTPLTLGQTNDGIFAMHFSLENQIQDNLRNLLMTNWGERVAFYHFGANLRELSLELGSDIFDREVMVRIKRAVNTWMPFVELQTFEKTIVGRVQGASVSQVNLLIKYNVPKLGIQNKAIELTFYFAG